MIPNWVIKVLEDSSGERLNSKNRNWLLENVEKLNIRVIVSECLANTFHIAREWAKEGSILIQEGEYLHFEGEFYPSKQALLLAKYDNGFLVFLYVPK